MRNILLLILVATIPLMSVAQKRSKKGSNAKMDKMVKKSPSEYEYMIIESVAIILLIVVTRISIQYSCNYQNCDYDHDLKTITTNLDKEQ